MLEMELGDEEVKRAVFEMDKSKTAGIDGFNASFYQFNWEVIGSSVCKMVRKTFQKGRVDPNINKSMIVLIPKVAKPESFHQLRPISLINVGAKIFSKVVANRIRRVMPLLVSSAQSSFVPGRNIVDNIITAQEAIHSMGSMKGVRGWMAIKIDLTKAYDMISWSFIEETLSDAKIPPLLSQVIMSALKTGTTRVVWDGLVGEEFAPSGGVRQGDPVSPYVFVLCMERLSQAIELKVQEGKWKPATFGKDKVTLSHLLFADDLILFAEATV